VRLLRAALRVARHAPLLQHRAALLAQVAGRRAYGERELRHDAQRVAHQRGVAGVAGHHQLVHRLVRARVRVLACSKLRANALQEAHNLVALILLSGVEGQVLHDVRHTALALLLHHAAHLDHKTEGGAVLGLDALPHIVG